MSSSLVNAAASIKPPVSGVDTIIIASAASAARVAIPASWRNSYLTIHADGVDLGFAFTTSVSLAVSLSAVTTITSNAVASHGTGECEKLESGLKAHYDLRQLRDPGAGEWYFAHIESATGGFIRLTRSSGQAKL